MGTLTDGPQLVFNHIIFHGMIGDPKFYAKVPAFFFMKEQGLAIYEKMLEAMLTPGVGCLGCSNVKKTLQPLMSMFAKHAFELAQDSPEALEPLVEYIAEKKGYRPKPIILYYRYEGIVHKLEL